MEVEAMAMAAESGTTWLGVGVFLALAIIAVRLEMLQSRLKDTKQMTRRLLEMHQHADDYGFGTVETNKLLRANSEAQTELLRAVTANTLAVGQLIHVFNFDYHERTGTRVPPKTPEVPS